MDNLIECLTAAKVKPVYAPKDVGFAIMTAIYDPDGNYIEFTKLSDKWFGHLEKRRSLGIDVIKRWRSHKLSAH